MLSFLGRRLVCREHLGGSKSICSNWEGGVPYRAADQHILPSVVSDDLIGHSGAKWSAELSQVGVRSQASVLHSFWQLSSWQHICEECWPQQCSHWSPKDKGGITQTSLPKGEESLDKYIYKHTVSLSAYVCIKSCKSIKLIHEAWLKRY